MSFRGGRERERCEMERNRETGAENTLYCCTHLDARGVECVCAEAMSLPLLPVTCVGITVGVREGALAVLLVRLPLTCSWC